MGIIEIYSNGKPVSSIDTISLDLMREWTMNKEDILKERKLEKKKFKEILKSAIKDGKKKRIT
jgi:hypothetical protein